MDTENIYSKFYLNRLFSESTGSTIYKYIKMRRLTEAARKLVYTEKTIIDIAFEANYQSQQAFTNAFTNIYSCSPQVSLREIYIRAEEQPHEYNSICC